MGWIETIKAILVNTPWWVYVLLIVLIKAGLRAANTGVVPVTKLLILPVIFGFLAVHTWLTQFPVTSNTTWVFLGSNVIAAILGYIYVHRQNIRVNRQKMLLEVPGTWTTMILIIVIFASKYYFGYRMGVDPSIIHNVHFDYAWLIVSGLCTGYIIGRALCYFYKLYTQESVDLKVAEDQ